MNTDDKPIPEDDAIEAVHPLRTQRPDLYQEAQRMVSAKHSKFALVELVNWLLHKVEDAELQVDPSWEPRTAIGLLPQTDSNDEALIDQRVAKRTASLPIKRITRTAAPAIQFDDDPIGLARDAVVEAAKAWANDPSGDEDDRSEQRLEDDLVRKVITLMEVEKAL